MVFVRKTSHLTLQMKSKYAKEHSTAYKVGGLEFISEKAGFPVPRANAIFLARQSCKQYSEFLRIFEALPGTLGKIYSRSVIESHQVNY